MYFYKSIERAVAGDSLQQRCLNLRSCLRITMYTMVARGLYVRHKLIFLAQLTFNLMKRGNLGDENLLNDVHFQFLLRGPRKEGEDNPLASWLPTSAWQSIGALADLEEFGKFPSDLVETVADSVNGLTMLPLKRKSCL
jgi:dynein heavy chain, axonemal